MVVISSSAGRPATTVRHQLRDSQHSFNRLLQTAKIVADDPPDRVRINTVIRVAKYLSETSDRLPRLLGRQRLGIALQSPGGLRAATLHFLFCVVRNITNGLLPNLCLELTGRVVVDEI